MQLHGTMLNCHSILCVHVCVSLCVYVQFGYPMLLMRKGTMPYFAHIRVKACASCMSVTDYCRCKYVRIQDVYSEIMF